MQLIVKIWKQGAVEKLRKSDWQSFAKIRDGLQFRILTSSRENAVDGGLYHAGHRAKFIDGDVSVVAVFKNTRGDRFVKFHNLP